MTVNEEKKEWIILDYTNKMRSSRFCLRYTTTLSRRFYAASDLLLCVTVWESPKFYNKLESRIVIVLIFNLTEFHTGMFLVTVIPPFREVQSILK